MSRGTQRELELEAEVQQLRQRLAELENERQTALRDAEEVNRKTLAALEALRESEERFSVLTQNLQSAVALVDEQGAFRIVNSAFLRMFGIPDGADIPNVDSLDWAQWQVFDERGLLLDPDEHPVRKAALRRTAVKNQLVAVKSPSDSNLKWLLISAAPLLNAQGKLHRLICTYYDITDRKQSEAALKESRAKLQAALASMNDAVFISDAQGRFVEFNEAFATFHKFASKDECLKTLAEYPDILDVFLPDGTPAPLDMSAVPRALRGETATNAEYSLRRKDTGESWVGSYSFAPIRDESGVIVGSVAVGRDVTELKQAEEALRRSERLYRAIGESIDYGIWICDPDGRNTYASESFLKLVGMTQEHCSNFGWGNVLHPDDAEKTIAAWKECVRTESRWDIEHRFWGVDGEWHPILARGVPVRDDHGRIACWAGINLDISAIKRAEEQTRRADAVLDAFFAASPGILNIEDEDFRYLKTDRLTPTYFGLTRESIVGRKVSDLAPDFIREFGPMMREVVETGRPRLNVEVRSPVPGRSGEMAHWLASYFPVPLPEGKRGIGIIGIEITENKKAEERLRRAQKLESIGLLAGGVAHDFNNLLVAIKGYSEMVLSDLDPDDSLYTPLLEILKAGERAAALTRQLLAFSGNRVTRPEVLDVNNVVRDLQTMLRRLVTEEIEIKTDLAADIWRTSVDPTQIEQLVMNLAINARDAMPRGGALTIATSNTEVTEEPFTQRPSLKPGRYVSLSVSDTGVGMSPEIQSRIFEPFFTTKGPGEGAGLGLSTVYGIVKQHGGDIFVYSEVDRGSTFRVYLPAADVSGQPAVRKLERSSAYAGTETILVVEDDATALGLTVRMLRRLGYEVLTASSGTEALNLSATYRGRIDLLITDVIMPGFGGQELSRRILVHRPELKVLLMSGYPRRFGTEPLESGTTFLQKPFGINDIGRSVREALGGLDRT